MSERGEEHGHVWERVPGPGGWSRCACGAQKYFEVTEGGNVQQGYFPSRLAHWGQANTSASDDCGDPFGLLSDSTHSVYLVQTDPTYRPTLGARVVSAATFEWALNDTEVERACALIRECGGDAEEAKRRFLAEREAAKDAD